MSRNTLTCHRCKTVLATLRPGKIAVTPGVTVVLLTDRVHLTCTCGAERTVTLPKSPERKAA